MSIRTYFEERRVRKRNTRQLLTQLESIEPLLGDYLETRFASLDDKLKDDDLRDVLAPYIMFAGFEASAPITARIFASVMATRLRDSLEPLAAPTPKQLFGACEITIDASAIVIYSLLSERFEFEPALERFRRTTGTPAASCSNELIALAPIARGTLDSAFVDRVHDAVFAYCVSAFAANAAMPIGDTDKELFDSEFRSALTKGMNEAEPDMESYEARMSDRRIRAADTALSESE